MEPTDLFLNLQYVGQTELNNISVLSKILYRKIPRNLYLRHCIYYSLYELIFN